MDLVQILEILGIVALVMWIIDWIITHLHR